MAKKKHNQKIAPASAKKAPEPHKNTPASVEVRKRPWALYADGVLMLVFLFVNNWIFKLDIQFYFAIGAAAIFFVTMLGKGSWKLLFSKITTILIVLLAQCLLYFVGLFYAAYAKFALQQFFLNTGALFVFATAYISVLRQEINTEKLMSIFSAAVVVAALVSIELATSNYLGGFFRWLGNFLKAQVPADYGAFEVNTRITTVLGTPNVFAPLCVFAMFMSLWICGEAGQRSRKSLLQMTLALISGTAFILCFSLGTILAYIVMLVAYMILVAKKDKGAQLLRHIFGIAASLIIASLVYAVRSHGILPLAAVVALSLLAAFAYAWIKPVKRADLQVKKSGTSARWAVTAGIVAVCAGVVLLALFLRGDYSMAAGAAFKRAVPLKPGTYSLQATFGGQNADSAVTVDISSMSYAEAALKTNTPLLSQQVKQEKPVQFTVPDASAAVFVNIKADIDLILTSANLSGDGTSVDLPLHYKILPEFIVNRLQGLWVNDNAIQRFVFYRDGLRLSMKSPVVGLGGGAFEGGVLSVSDYYYTTKHSHNEFIERFIDGGIIGFLLFAALPAAVFRALGKSRKNEKLRGIVPLLFAFMTMLFLHAFIEVDFLMIGYRIGSALLFALVAALCGEEFKLSSRVKTAARYTFAGTFAVTVLLSAGHYFGVKTLEWNPSLESIDSGIWMDPFNSMDYKLSYVLSTGGATDPRVVRTRDKYLKSISGNSVGADALAEYYLTKTADALQGVKEAELYVRQNRVDPKAWNSVASLYLSVLSTAQPGSDTALIVKASVKSLDAYLNELNSTLPMKITPDQTLYAALRAAAGI
jgi:hypothetical protein